MFEIKGIFGKSQNVQIILGRRFEISRRFFFYKKINIMCQISSRSDALRKKVECTLMITHIRQHTHNILKYTYIVLWDGKI